MLRAASRCSVSALVAALLATVPSCASSPRTLSWRVEFGSAALHARTETVVARVLEGGCDGDVVYDASIHASDAMTVAPPLLGPGRYGLAAFAIDHACAIVASDCREVVVPTEGEITLLLNDEADAPACPSDVCTGHGCAMDAGLRDAGTADVGAHDAGDAGRIDAGAMDAAVVDGGAIDGGVIDGGAMDAGIRDAGPPDTGTRDTGPRDTGPRDTGVDAVVCTTSAPRAMGSFVASPWFSRVDATGATIQLATSGGAMGTITLSGGVTATGSVIASELCTGTCTPLSFRGVTAVDHTLTFRDWRDVESTITLVGATATGGLELGGSDGYLVSVTATARTITLSNGAMPPVTGTITLTPETTCP